MSDNLHKFLFLGVMILVTVFANHTPPLAEQGVALGNNAPAHSTRVTPPIFALEAPARTFIPNLIATTSGDGAVDAASFSIFASSTIISSSTFADLGFFLGNKGDVKNNTVLDSNLDEPGILPTAPEAASDFFLRSGDNPSRSLFYKTGDEIPPRIGAPIALVADLKSGEKFFSLDQDKRWPLASLTKLISAAVVLRNISQNQSTTISAADFTSETSDKNLNIGDRFSVSDLLLAMLLESSNESTEALANFYGRERFLSDMQKQITDWGLKDTYFADPTGLSVSNQSTESDLLVLASHLYGQYPEILKITRKISATIRELNLGKLLKIVNINLFAGRPEFLGGKTGYTDEARGNLLSIFSYKRKPILVVVLGAEDRFGDTEKLFNWFKRNYQ